MSERWRTGRQRLRRHQHKPKQKVYIQQARRKAEERAKPQAVEPPTQAKVACRLTLTTYAGKWAISQGTVLNGDLPEAAAENHQKEENPKVRAKVRRGRKA